MGKKVGNSPHFNFSDFASYHFLFPTFRFSLFNYRHFLFLGTCVFLGNGKKRTRPPPRSGFGRAKLGSFAPAHFAICVWLWDSGVTVTGPSPQWGIFSANVRNALRDLPLFEFPTLPTFRISHFSAFLLFSIFYFWGHLGIFWETGKSKKKTDHPAPRSGF